MLSLDGDEAEALALTYTFNDKVFVTVDFAVGLNRVSLSGPPDEIRNLLTAALQAVEQARPQAQNAEPATVARP